MPKTYWTYPPIQGFDDFGSPYGTKPGAVMYDAMTDVGGMWANMTQESWEVHGCDVLGLGFGQKYVLQDDGRWLCVEGDRDTLGVL